MRAPTICRKACCRATDFIYKKKYLPDLGQASRLPVVFITIYIAYTYNVVGGVKMFCNCDCRYNCNGVALVASLIIGIIGAVLSFTGVITIAAIFYSAVFVVAAVYLAVLLISFFVNRNQSKPCVCRSITLVLGGALGTILTSLIILAASFAATSVLGTIIVGATLFFVSLLFAATACLIRCLAGCEC